MERGKGSDAYLRHMAASASGDTACPLPGVAELP